MPSRLLLVAVLLCCSTSTLLAAGASLAISPRVLQDMLRTSDSYLKVAGRQSISEGSIPFPAAIAFDADGCFAGYFPSADLSNLRFECIKGTERLALSAVAPEAAKQAAKSMAVLELIPSFAIGKCGECGTINADLRETLKSKGVEAIIIRADIALR